MLELRLSEDWEVPVQTMWRTILRAQYAGLYGFSGRLMLACERSMIDPCAECVHRFWLIERERDGDWSSVGVFIRLIAIIMMKYGHKLHVCDFEIVESESLNACRCLVPYPRACCSLLGEYLDSG